jgi:hypothetical protein
VTSTYNKPFLTIDEQIDRLMKRGLEIDSRQQASHHPRHAEGGVGGEDHGIPRQGQQFADGVFGFPGEAGVVVVTYCTPILGAPTTTAITASQAAQVPEQQAQIFWADTDTQAIFVHNWGLPNSFPTWLWPQCLIVKSLGGASDSSFATNFTFGLTNTNSVAITKVGIGTGQGGTYNVWLRRPHSIGQ